MATKKSEIIARVEENQQAIVLVLLAKNSNGGAILDSQLELAMNMAKNVLQMGGAEVAASGSAIRFDATATGETARITATLETIGENDEIVEEPTEPEEEPSEEEDE